MNTKNQFTVQVKHNNADYLINYHYFDNDLRIDTILRHYFFSFFILTFQINFSLYRKVKQRKLPISLYNSILFEIQKTPSMLKKEHNFQ